ncbi:methyl-accepting chemotaxis protein [Pseudomonas lini]
MYRWLAEKLGNVSVNRKLGVGFGLVLLLTLLITFTGWTGLGGVISRGDTLGFISSLNELTKDLRLARLDYDMRRGEQGPGAVNELIGQLDTGLKNRPHADRTACRRGDDRPAIGRGQRVQTRLR